MFSIAAYVITCPIITSECAWLLRHVPCRMYNDYGCEFPVHPVQVMFLTISKDLCSDLLYFLQCSRLWIRSMTEINFTDVHIA